jgi:predicted nucleic acid-binding protein
MSADKPLYVDSSAIVKLAVREPESPALRTYLRRSGPLISSALARTEVLRALLPLGEAAIQRGRGVLSRFELVRVSDRLLERAGLLPPSELRSLDAIHLATAQLIGIVRIVTYDVRMAAAARRLGWQVLSPA